MGRGGSFLILSRPAWLLRKSACLILWNDLPNEWHLALVESALASDSQGTTERHALGNLGRIHQTAAVSNNGGVAWSFPGKASAPSSGCPASNFAKSRKSGPDAGRAAGDCASSDEPERSAYCVINAGISTCAIKASVKSWTSACIMEFSPYLQTIRIAFVAAPAGAIMTSGSASGNMARR